MSSDEATPLSNSDHILFDMPVSNNGARIRAILYYKKLSQQQVDIISPMKLVGGLRSDEFKALSPQGLMPALTIQKEHDSGMTHLSESDTIARYLLAEYASVGPSFQPDNPRSNQITRWHDVYLTTIQGCLYKPAYRFPLGNYADRKSAIKAFEKNLKVIEGFMSDEGKYLCGDEVSLADASLFPTCTFAKYMLPKFDDSQTPLPPKLNAWFDNLCTNDSVFAKIYGEIMDTLVTSWDEKSHLWDSIWLSGQRDQSPGTLFDKIVAKEIPATIVKEDRHILAFKDINPLAPAHVLVIPKDRNGLTNLRNASAEHRDILGRLLVAGGEIANDSELGFGDGARFVINDGPDGGQEVYHLHLHVIGGQKLGSMC
eukprot:scaffold26687_cov69-Skeletonema_dohrnii-CCMP3373.AAC.2